MTIDKHSFDALSYYIDMLLDAICVVDREGYFLYVSAGAERIFGYTPEEMIGRQMLDMVHPDDRRKTLGAVDEIMSGVARVDFENRYLRKDGSIVHLLWSARWSEIDGMRVAVARDISKMKQAERMQTALFDISETAHTEESLPALYQRIHEIIAGLIPIKQFVIGLYQAESNIVQLVYKRFIPGELSKEVDLESLCAQVSQSGQSWPQAADEDSPSQDWLAVPLKSQDGIVGALMVNTNTSQEHYCLDERELLEFVSTQIAAAIERKKMLDELQYLALFDPLTGLPNRQLFKDRLKQALARARRNQQSFAVLYLDLDKFKQANDQFGHEAGDSLLQEVARRLEACVRESDTVARMGGDEFVILLDKLTGSESVGEVAEKILSELSRPYHLATAEADISVSIGTAVYPRDGKTEQALLHHADKKMYTVKSRGGRQVSY